MFSPLFLVCFFSVILIFVRTDDTTSKKLKFRGPGERSGPDMSSFR